MERKLSNVVIWAESPEELRVMEEVLRQKKFDYDINTGSLCAEIFESLSPSGWDEILDEIMAKIDEEE